ncbi:Capsular polysaccharide type 8 biosynthesis protein cap8A [compost metagenome]
MISVSSKKDTEMLQIMVLNENPQLSSQIANNTAEVFSKEIVNIYNIKNVSIIDKADISEKPYNLNVIKQMLMFFISGFILSLILSFIVYYFDTSVKSPEEVESKLGLPLLTVIPIYKK